MVVGSAVGSNAAVNQQPAIDLPFASTCIATTTTTTISTSNTKTTTTTAATSISAAATTTGLVTSITSTAATSVSSSPNTFTFGVSPGVTLPCRRSAPPSFSPYQPAAKKARYEGCALGNKPSSVVEVRQALIRWKRGKMEAVRDSYNTHEAEYFFLTNDGNLMDMASWLKKPTPELLAYHKHHRLDGDTSNLATTVREAALKLSGASGYKKEDHQDQMVEKARHEAYVVARIAQLRKEGLWTEKRLPKVHEPARPKCHWDYLLEEMVWLSADFAQERKWKKAAAKKCAKMVQKYFQDKEQAAERAQKEEEMRLRKIASFMAREVRTFWNNVEKLVHYKINTKHDEKKKKALDQQLSFIVDQTEKYSGMLVESMRRPADSSAVSTRSETPSVASLSDCEFEPSENSEDDEATILKEDDDPSQQADEVKLLQQESGQTLDDLLTSLPPEYLASLQGLQTDADTTLDNTLNTTDSTTLNSTFNTTDSSALNTSANTTLSTSTLDITLNTEDNNISNITATNTILNSSTTVEGATSLVDGSLLSSGGSTTRSGRKRRLSSAGSAAEEANSRETRSQSSDIKNNNSNNISNKKLSKQSTSSSSCVNSSSNFQSNLLEETTSTGGGDDVAEAMDVDPDVADAEYVAEEEEDDEKTLAEQEQHEGTAADHQQEIQQLQADNELSLEELRRKYAALPPAFTPDTPAGSEEEEDDSEEDEDDDDGDLDDGVSETRSMDTSVGAADVDSDGDVTGSDDDDSVEEDGDVALKSLMEDSSDAEAGEKADQELEEATAVAEALQPKGFTLSSTAVTTPVPFLLKHSLREYQHVGLDWLTTMFDKNLNGILADEMGLGKTIQTISLLAHLACGENRNWGPHLIVVPTSVMLNWEMELKKWCPAFKILTYFGSQKERKLKRQGWTKLNAFHVCITSYKLVIQDHQSFRRKKWKYFILDEAQNIKNFKSKRWQLLLNFQSDRRLLLTGTPLQNNLMELWSLMHFLMPHVFASHREFKEWFSNPVTGMIQGNSEYNDNIIKRLHKVLRPFILRRLKSEVEQQMPKKYEHVVMCRLSKRQRFLYEEFMSRTKTRETLSSGNFLSVINVLMQLRKVCNHPNLFEERQTVSPLMMEPLNITAPSCCWNIAQYDPFKHVDLFSLNLLQCDLELTLTAFAAHRIRRFQCPHRLITEIDNAPLQPPRCPPGKIRLHVRQSNKSSSSSATSSHGAQQNTGGQARPRPIPSTASLPTPAPLPTNPATASNVRYQLIQHQGALRAIPIAVNPSTAPRATNNSGSSRLSSSTAGKQSTGGAATALQQQPLQGLQLMHTSTGQLLLTTAPRAQQQHPPTAVTTQQGLSTGSASALLQKLQSIQGIKSLQGSVITMGPGGRPVLRLPPPPPQQQPQAPPARPAVPQPAPAPAPAQNCGPSAQPRLTPQCTPQATPQGTPLNTPQPTPLPSPTPASSPGGAASDVRSPVRSTRSREKPSSSTQHKTAAAGDDRKRTIFFLSELEEGRAECRREKLSTLSRLNTRKCRAYPIYGGDLLAAVSLPEHVLGRLCSTSGAHKSWRTPSAIGNYVQNLPERLHIMQGLLGQFVFCVPAVVSRQPQLLLHHPDPSAVVKLRHLERDVQQQLRPVTTSLHSITNATLTHFPDPRLIQYDCGKLQTLDRLLRQLKTGNHRVLIFTQMTRMLDVFESFLNYHGHIYVRLDGTTKVQDRQVLMERFNQDSRIFVFILSTRSGGIGVNLTGADTVIFYDSDWNPTMDAQAQDRCHRIGQTRDVHIYRLISEKTIEENILKKANQKRMLGNLAIEGGNFTTAYFKEQTIQELFSISKEQNASHRMAELLDSNTSSSQTAPLITTTTTTTSTTLPNTSTTDGSGESPPAAAASPASSNIRAGALENALAAAEDETDVVAARHAMAEAAADLAEFDENIPLNDDNSSSSAAAVAAAARGSQEPPSKVQQEIDKLMDQLTGVERYAMNVLERADEGIAHEQHRLEQQLEQQKRDWELDRKRAIQSNQQMMNNRVHQQEEDPLTVTTSQVNDDAGGDNDGDAEEEGSDSEDETTGDSDVDDELTDSDQEGESEEEESKSKEESSSSDGEGCGSSKRRSRRASVSSSSSSKVESSSRRKRSAASPRTRSRVQVNIDLWTLDNKNSKTASPTAPVAGVVRNGSAEDEGMLSHESGEEDDDVDSAIDGRERRRLSAANGSTEEEMQESEGEGEPLRNGKGMGGRASSDSGHKEMCGEAAVDKLDEIAAIKSSKEVARNKSDSVVEQKGKREGSHVADVRSKTHLLDDVPDMKCKSDLATDLKPKFTASGAPVNKSANILLPNADETVR